LDSPARLTVLRDGVPTLLASSLLGAIRHCFRSYLNVEPNSPDEEQLFGTADRRGRIKVVDLRFEGAAEERIAVRLDRFTGTAAQDSLAREVVVPSGAMFVGAVWFDGTATERELTLLRSAIASVELLGIGAGRALGYGLCRLEFLDLKEVGRVFLSYAWEDEEHNEWVLHLADRLTKEGISVIFDRYDLRIGENVHVFMEQALDRAAKVLLVLTPVYKEKATTRTGGVGFEFSMITSELFETLASNKKFIPVLRRGTPGTSIPKVLLPFKYCDMTVDHLFERQFTELYGAIIGRTPLTRPISRFGNSDG
jgi:hypothetical protein